MGTFKLRIKYDLNLAECAEIAQRVRDFSIPFASIVAEWARGNVEKFDAGKGSESSGFSGGSLTPLRWEPLTEKYRRAKERAGFANWLMVRTGNLMQSLLNVSGFAQFVDAHRVIFGAPIDAEAADAAMYNREKRNTIFLGESDRLGIKRELQNYISFGENYKQFLFSRAGRMVALKKEVLSMDLNFSEAVNG